MQALKAFLADYWLWILVPALLIGAGLAALLMLAKDDEWTPHDYDTVGRVQWEHCAATLITARA